MPGKIIKIGNPHYCERPNLYKWRNRKIVVTGTQWQCDECNVIYEIRFSRYSSYYPFYWQEISGNQE